MHCGSKAQVYHGNAKMTSGGIKKDGLKKNAKGKIVSKGRSKAAMSGPLAEWRKCVKAAKKELGVPDNKFILLRKKLGKKRDKDAKLGREIHKLATSKCKAKK